MFPRLFFIAVLIFFSAKLSAQIVNLQDQFVGFVNDSTDGVAKLNPEQSRVVDRFWSVYRELRDDEMLERSLYGKIKFGVAGDRSNDQDFFRINSEILLRRGIYPLEFKLKALLYVLVSNGKLTENLSDLWITYDQFFDADKDGFDKDFTYEGLFYINRRNDRFLGVEQRYEVGGGIIFSHWSTKPRRDENHINPELINFEYEKNEIVMNEYNESGELINRSSVPVRGKLKPNTFEVIRKAQKQTVNSHVKMNSPFRIGILVGLFYELERITANDSLQTDNGKIFARHDFDPTNRIRWELEPIIYLHSSKHLYLTITPQFKLPLWYEWRANVGGKSRIDYRLDVPVNLEVVLSKSFTIELSYHAFYDNAPSSIQIPDFIRPDGSDVYLTANNLNQFFSLQIGYKFH